MTIEKKPEAVDNIVIDLDGPNGNAFYLRIFESGVGTLFEWNETDSLSTDQILTASFVPAGTVIDIIFRAVDTVVEWDNVSLIEDIGLVESITPIQTNIIGNIQGVQTVVSTKIRNIYDSDNGYSGNVYDLAPATKNGIIYPSLDPMIFEVKCPDTDIKGRVVSL